MRKGTANPLWLLGDHLGSTSLVANYDGTIYINGTTPARQGYKAWGEKRYPAGASPLPTTFRYTGQRESSGIGLYWYGSRYYDSSLGRFTSPDTVVPQASQGVQAWDRYAYANNDPVKYNDPSGHCIGGLDTLACIGLILAAAAFVEENWPEIESIASEEGPTITEALPAVEDAASQAGAEVGGAIENVVEKASQAVEGPGDTLLRGASKAATNPKVYELGPRDYGSGMSTYSKPPVSPKDVLDAFPQKDRVIGIPANGLPEGLGLEWIKTPGTLPENVPNSSFLNTNHWELRNPMMFANHPWEEYKAWWNDVIAPILTDAAKDWPSWKY